MTARQRLAELLEQVVRKLVIALVTHENGLRIKPATIGKLREIIADAFLAVRQVLEMHDLVVDDKPTEDELADTRPMRTRPPPPPPKNP